MEGDEVKNQEKKVDELRHTFEEKMNNLKNSLEKLKTAVDKLSSLCGDVQKDARYEI